MSPQEKKTNESAQKEDSGEQFQMARLILFAIVAVVLTIGAIILNRMI